MSTTVEVIADAIKEAGTPFIAGHPGGESVELMDALRQRDMRFILMKQEVAGAMLSATWGEITGSPGVCLSTRGPGAANMVNGVAHALLDRAPLIAITDQYSAATYAIGLRQRIDQIALYAPVVKWSSTIHASTVHQQIRRAMREATAAPPGPIHFDMPQSETVKEAAVPVARAPLVPNSVIPGPDRPVLTTSKCKGVMPEDHPLRAGCIIGGLIERKLVSESDLIIAVGLDSVELQPKSWPYTQPVLALSGTPSLDACVPATLEVVSDLKVLLERLAGWVHSGDNWGEKAAAVFRRDVIDALNTPATGLSPQRAMEVARAALPRNTIATCDAGASRLLIVQKWESYGPREFLTSNGLGSMGYAVPGALAARLAYPDRPVVAFSGDGGFLMAVAELQTSVREKLPIIVIVLDDEEIGLIRVKQEIKGIPRYGIGVGGLDWEKLAQGFGADGTVVSTEQGLQAAIAAALRSGRTTVIGVRIDASGYVAQFNALREL